MECFTITAISKECQNWQTECAFGSDAAGKGDAWCFYYNGVGQEKIYAGQFTTCKGTDLSPETGEFNYRCVNLKLTDKVF